MRFVALSLCAAALLALLAGCVEERPITVLFTGDDHGVVAPVG